MSTGGHVRRKLGGPEKLKIVKLEGDATLEFRVLGYERYHWAFCRRGETVRWLDYGTLEWDLAELAPYRDPNKPEVKSIIPPFV